MFPVCCITVQQVLPWALQLFVYHRITGTGVWAACVWAFVRCLLCMLDCRDGESAWKTPQKCAVAPSQTLHHSSTTKWSAKRMSGLWECHCAELTGWKQWLCCAACLFGRLHCSILVRGTAGFWLCEPCWPGLCLLVTDPLCPECLQLIRPLRAADYPTVIGAWALADQRWPADCGALVIFHSLMRCSPCLFVCLPACPHRLFLWQRGERFDCQLYNSYFSHNRWQGLAVPSFLFQETYLPCWIKYKNVEKWVVLSFSTSTLNSKVTSSSPGASVSNSCVTWLLPTSSLHLTHVTCRFSVQLSSVDSFLLLSLSSASRCGGQWHQVE